MKRQAKFETLSDKDRDDFAVTIGTKAKQLAAEFTNWDEFESWYNDLKGLEFKLDGTHVEGFVIEDTEHYHVKVKLDFYSFWKQLRSALDAIKAGRQPKIKQECEYPDFAQEVIDFMQLLHTEEIAKDTIIDIRRKFLARK